MKKATILTIIAVLAILSASCSQNDETGGTPPTELPTLSFSAGETEETPLPSDEAAVTESEVDILTEPKAEISNISVQPTPTPSPNNSTASQGQQRTQSTPSQNAQGSQTPAQPQKPVQTPAPTETPRQTSTPAPAQPPTTAPSTPEPQQPPEPEPPTPPTPVPADFNPQPYVDYAVSYGQSIGLIYEPAIGTGNWNSPVNLYDALTDENMKLGIRSSCDILITEGFEYFCVEASPNGDNSYRLFVYFG